MRQARLRLAHARAGIKRHDSSEVENNLYIPWERESSWEECILLKKNRPTSTTGIARVVYTIMRLRAINRDKSRCSQPGIGKVMSKEKEKFFSN